MLPLNSSRNLCCLLLAVFLMFIGASSTIAAPPSAEHLQVLVNETSAQIQLAYRLHPTEGQQRQEQLNAAVAAWRAAPHTDANNEQLTTWLHSAIRASMPGSRAKLQPIPAFKSNDHSGKRPLEPTPAETHPSAVVPVDKHAVGPTPVIESTTPADEETDPFRDDPIGEQK